MSMDLAVYFYWMSMDLAQSAYLYVSKEWEKFIFLFWDLEIICYMVNVIKPFLEEI